MLRQLLAGPALALAFLGSAVARAQAPEPRLDVVWLVVEDLSPWLACYGDPTVPTPYLDRLAAESVRFTNAFATAPVCAPARSTLITGVHAARMGTMHHRTSSPSQAEIRANPAAYRDIPDYEGVPPAFVRCFPELLRAHGYYCSNSSKTDYQFQQPGTVWDDSGRGGHWRNRTAGQPFFAVFNHGVTHEGMAFPRVRAQRRTVDPAKVKLPPFYPDTADVREAVARTYDNIAAMDGWVGDRLAELSASHALDSTVVVFFADHGVGLPRGKRSCYDLGLRVPLLVRFPDGRGAGTTDDRVVRFVDFGPTVLSLCGIAPDPRLDGVPFLGPHARAGKGLAFAHGDRFDAGYDRQRSVSDGRYRLVRNYLTDAPYLLANAYREQLPMLATLHALRGRTDLPPEQWQFAATRRPAEEFYDSAQDPWPVRNLIDHPEHRERVAALRQALDAWIADTGDLGFVLPETKLVREKLWPPDGVQPVTPPAHVRCSAHEGGALVAIECPEPGASIGWRNREEDPWQVYTAPFVAKVGRKLAVTTHRIGHAPTVIEVEVAY
ncbi:MAG: sulfatase [Planctomycetes bacterium]|nr:sulfatase [Planctomycetota bacterium]